VSIALGLPVHPKIGCNEFSFVAQAMLRICPWDDWAVVEIGVGRVGQMRTYAEMIRPETVVVTSIASEHLRSFQDLGVTRTEKADMVRILAPTGLAVLNGDDPNVLWMKKTTHARVTTFGFADANDVRASDVTLDWPHGTRFRLHVRGIKQDVRTRLIGRTFVYPILAAVAVGLEAGLSLDAILSALEHLPPTPERLQPIRLENGAILLRDEFKSTLETIYVALDVLAEIPARRKIVVLADVSEPPGSQGPIYRRIGRRIATAATHAVFLGSGCQPYASGAAKGGLPQETITKAGRSLQKAVEAIPTDLQEGDVVLIKGRDNQRLARVALGLMGRSVRCDIPFCSVIYSIRCDQCKMLERGWHAGLI